MSHSINYNSSCKSIKRADKKSVEKAANESDKNTHADYSF